MEDKTIKGRVLEELIENTKKVRDALDAVYDEEGNLFDPDHTVEGEHRSVTMRREWKTRWIWCARGSDPDMCKSFGLSRRTELNRGWTFRMKRKKIRRPPSKLESFARILVGFVRVIIWLFSMAFAPALYLASFCCGGAIVLLVVNLVCDAMIRRTMIID